MTDDLQALSDAATPGPWRAQGGPQDGIDYVVGPTPDDFLTGPLRRANAAYIVALVNRHREGRLAVSPSPATDAGLAKHVHDLLASVAFLRSVIASGETLNASDEARLREVYEAARLATPDKDQPDDHRHGALCANGWCDEDDGGLR